VKTDKELLDQAAKAAGYELLWGDVHPMIKCTEPEHPSKTHNIWNPLADDGDALRLAARLGLLEEDPSLAQKFAEEQGHPGDPTAATRRAIVVAAAEMTGRVDD
jgi:hypothetical protein